MNDAVTIIVGAGAVLDFDHKGIFPSVKKITDEVLKQNIQKVDGGERPLLREIYEHVVKKLNRVLETNHIKPPQLNFENLLHVIEMCIAHIISISILMPQQWPSLLNRRTWGPQLELFFDQNMETMKLRAMIGEHILSQFRSRYLDLHCTTPRERYEMLLQRCPGIVEFLDLQDIASFLNVHPNTARYYIW